MIKKVIMLKKILKQTPAWNPTSRTIYERIDSRHRIRKIREVVIELTTRCNLSCTYCPHIRLPKSQIGDMDLELFKRIVDSIPNDDNGLVVNPSGLGEPLLYKKLDYALAYIREKLDCKETAEKGYFLTPSLDGKSNFLSTT